VDRMRWIRQLVRGVTPAPVGLARADIAA
jgi:hypothetical protein